MSLISFLKDAGEKLFNKVTPSAQASTPAQSPAAPAAPAANVAQLSEVAATAIEKYIATQGLKAEGLDVKFDAASQTVTVSGVAADQATKEKIVLCCGNVDGVAHVDDRLTVAASGQAPGTYHVVKSGDTLSAIAKTVYGNANAYTKIFEANKPMLSDPNKIYPGQTLRIPVA